MNKKEWITYGFVASLIFAIVSTLAAMGFASAYAVGVDDLKFLQEDFDALLVEKQACGDGWYEQLELTATLMTMLEERENHQSYCPEGNWRNYIDGLREELKTCKSALDGVADWYNEAMRGAPCHSHYDGLHCVWETFTENHRQSE